MRHPSFKNNTKTSTYRSKESYQEEFQVFPKLIWTALKLNPSISSHINTIIVYFWLYRSWFLLCSCYSRSQSVYFQRMIVQLQISETQLTTDAWWRWIKYQPVQSYCWVQFFLFLFFFFTNIQYTKHDFTQTLLGICNYAHCIEWSPNRGTLLWSENSLALNAPLHSCNTSSWHCFLMHMRDHLVGSLTEAHL